MFLINIYKYYVFLFVERRYRLRYLREIWGGGDRQREREKDKEAIRKFFNGELKECVFCFICDGCS